MTVEEIKNEISSLSKKDKKCIKDWLDYSLSTVTTKDTDFSIFYKIMSNKLESLGIFSPPMGLFLKNSKIKQTTFIRLSEYIDKISGHANQAKRVDLYGFFLDRLLSYMDERKIPVSVNSVIGSLGYIPGIIRISFPGYLEAGLLLKIASMPKQDSVDF